MGVFPEKEASQTSRCPAFINARIPSGRSRVECSRGPERSLMDIDEMVLEIGLALVLFFGAVMFTMIVML